MAKFLHKFNTNTNRLSYEDGNDYIEPYVSKVTEDVSVHYNKSSRYAYVDLGLPSGTLWATKNVGAETETDYGLYFAWGENIGYTADQVTGSTQEKAFTWGDYKWGDGGDKYSSMTKYNVSDGLSTLQSEDDAAYVICGNKWIMPTKEQYDELFSDDNTTKKWVVDYRGVSGVNGLIFISKFNGKELFFPATGALGDGILMNEGAYASYWSSTVDAYEPIYLINAYSLYFGEPELQRYVGVDKRYYGLPIRGVIKVNI